MQEGDNSLDSILNDEPAETVEAQAAEPAPVTPQDPEEAPSGPERDEHGRFVSTKGVEPGETPEPVPPTDKLPQEDYKAIREEREKRQRLESELEALRQTVQSLQQPQEPPAPPPSMWEDEQGWQQHFGQQIASQASINANLNTSEMLCRDKFDDFDDMKAKFIELARVNPAIADEARADPHPWRKAYQIAKNAASAAELGATNVEELKAKLREELLAEFQQGQTPLPNAQPLLPPTLTGERNVGGRSGPAWSGPPSLDQLLS